jgi:hypothetical protein
MDFSLIAAASSAIGAAREIGRAAVGVRDFNQLAATVSQLNDQLLKAQDALFTHQAQLLGLQQELFQTKEQLRIAQQVVEERGRYELFEISRGMFVYRLKLSMEAGAPGAEPVHYLCQPCFDRGVKNALIRREFANRVIHVCPSCRVEYLERELPVPAMRYGTRFE